MFERGPSIQKESVLHKRNGSRSDRRQRALDAAALVEELRPLVGDEDLRRFAAREMRLDLIGVPMDVDDRPFDAVLGQAVEAMIDQALVPATFTSGLGVASVIGRMRFPRPAANTMAVFGIGALIVDRSRVGTSEISLSGGCPNARGRWF